MEDKGKKRRLLVITQIVDENDDILAPFLVWFKKFANELDKVTIICLQKGETNFPSNVKVLSLGKRPIDKGGKGGYSPLERVAPKGRGVLSEKTPPTFKGGGWGVVKKISYTIKFYKYIWKERSNYDAVFVHMNPIYVVLGGLYWKLSRKKIALWYAHGHVPVLLKIAEKFVDQIFTSTKSGCRLDSKKVNVVGQGIDIARFKNNELRNKKDDIFRIVTVGRISPVKDYKTLIDAIEILKDKRIIVKIIGKAGTDNQLGYFVKMKARVKNKGLENKIKFLGSIPNKDIAQFYRDSDLYINNSLTGSLDKTILEAMASEKIILSCNESLFEVLGKHQKDLMFTKKNPQALAEKINWVMGLNNKQKQKIGSDLRMIVEQKHSVNNLIEKLINKIYS